MISGRKTKAILLAGTLLTGCHTQPTQLVRYDQSIADRAIEINDAYNAELNGQILKNILRARDRQPRFYTTLSDLGISPNAKVSGSTGLGSIGLGNPSNPWSVLSFGSARETSSSISLTVSPNAKSSKDANETIFHSPIGINTFLTYYSDWDARVVDNLMIDQIRKVDPGLTGNRKDVVDNILRDADGHFQVFVGQDLPGSPPVANCLPGNNCQTLSASYCFDAKDCNVTPGATEKEISKVRLSNANAATIKSYAQDLSDGNKMLSLRGDGVLYVCQNSFVSIENQGPGVHYDCRVANTFVSVSGPASLIYVGKLDSVDPSDAMYALTLSSIDNMIYRVGSSIRNSSSDLFEVYSGSVGGCKDSFAASVKHHGEDYYAGPPRGNKSAKCYQDDRSGAVLTLIAELIKLREVSAELVTSTLFISN